MNDKIRAFNKIISTMQQRFQWSQYYREILKDCDYNIDRAIKELINVQTDRIELLIESEEYDKLEINMLSSHIKELESLAVQ